LITIADASPVAPDGNGVVTRRINEPGEITLADAATLRGLIAEYENGDTLDPEPGEVYVWCLRSAGSATVSHQDGTLTADEWITTSTGASVVLGGFSRRLEYRHDGASWRWYLE